MVYITGFHAIEELIRSSKTKGAELLVAKQGPRIKKIVELCKKNNVPVKNISQAELLAMAPDNRGAALATNAELDKNIDLESWLRAMTKKSAIVFILDHIEDPHNFGAIIRSADVFAVDLLIVPQRRAAPQSDVVAKSSAGALTWVPIATVSNINRSIEMLKKHGFWIYAADSAGENIANSNLHGLCAVVMGAEGQGVSQLTKANCDGVVSIPQYGHIDSLNVSVAAGILMYEAKKKLGKH